MIGRLLRALGALTDAILLLEDEQSDAQTWREKQDELTDFIVLQDKGRGHVMVRLEDIAYVRDSEEGVAIFLGTKGVVHSNTSWDELLQILDRECVGVQ